MSYNKNILSITENEYDILIEEFENAFDLDYPEASQGKKHHFFNFYQNLLYISNLPKRFLLKAKHSEIEIVPKASLRLQGKAGSGKTHQIACAIKNLCLHSVLQKENVKAYFVSFPELFIEIRDHVLNQNNIHKSSNGKLNPLDIYSYCDYLFIDDLGPSKMSEWVYEQIYILIDRRYRENKHLTVSTNLSISEVENYLDTRIASRLYEMCELVEFNKRDMRRKE